MDSAFTHADRRDSKKPSFIGKIHWSQEALFLLGEPRVVQVRTTNQHGINLKAGPHAFSVLAQGKVNNVSEENQ